ncbi:SPW repeat protein [Nocardia sp. NPDC003693]
MFTESRVQDVVAVVLGVIAALSPLWVAHSDNARWSLIVGGVLIALIGLGHAAKRIGAVADYALVLVGALLFVSPWVLDFDSYSGATWTAWVAGGVTAVLALVALPAVSDRLGAVTRR